MTARFVLRMTNPGLRKHAFHRRFVWHASFPSRTREPVERHFNCLRAARAFVFNPTVEAFNRFVEEKNFLTMLTITVSFSVIHYDANTETLGQFEQLVLSAVEMLRDQAYGRAVSLKVVHVERRKFKPRQHCVYE